MTRIFFPILLAACAWGQSARFPAAVATDADLTTLTDRAQTTLSAPMTATATTFTVVSAAKFAANMILTAENEQIKICAVDVPSNTVTVGNSTCPNVDGRGFAGTAAASHASGKLISNYFVSYQFKALREEIKAVEGALGAGMANVPAPAVRAVDYNFDPQSPVESLTAGVGGSISFAPCPKGVNGTNFGYYIRTLDANPESLLITGGSCRSGAPAGNLIVAAPSYSHTGVGGYAVFSASGGLGEALNEVAAANPLKRQRVVVTESIDLYAPVQFPNQAWKPGFVLEGNGLGSSAITRAFASGPMFDFAESAGHQGSLILRDLTLYDTGSYDSPINGTGGAVRIYNNSSGDVRIENCVIFAGQYGIDIDGSHNVDVLNTRIINVNWWSAAYQGDAGIMVRHTRNDAGFNPSQIHILGVDIFGFSPTAAKALTAGIQIQVSDGVTIAKTNVGQVKYGIIFDGYAAKELSAIVISDCILDTFQKQALLFQGNLASASNILIDNLYAANRSDLYPNTEPSIRSDSSAILQNVSFNHLTVSGSGTNGMEMDGLLDGVSIRNSMIWENNLSNTVGKAGIWVGQATAKVDVQNNIVRNLGSGHAKFGVSFPNGAARALVAGNDFIGIETSGVSVGGAITAGRIEGNLGYNPVGPSTLTCSGSPCTLPATASLSPSVLYIAGGTVSDVSRGGSSVCKASPCAVNLPAGAQAVITYTGVPTTITLDVQ